MEEQGGIAEKEYRQDGGTMFAQSGAVLNRRKPNTSEGEGVELTELSRDQQEQIERRESALMQERAASREGGMNDAESSVPEQPSSVRNGHTLDPVEPGERDRQHASAPEQPRAAQRSKTGAEEEQNGAEMRRETVEVEVHNTEETAAKSHPKGAREHPKASPPPPLDIDPPPTNKQGEENERPTSSENPPASGAPYDTNSLPNAINATGKMAVSPPAFATMGRPVNQTTNQANGDLPHNSHASAPQTETQRGNFVELEIFPSPIPRHKKRDTTPGRRHSADQQPAGYNSGSSGQQRSAVARPLSFDQERIPQTDGGTRRYSAEPVILRPRLSRDLTTANRSSGEQETTPNSTSSLAQGNKLYTEARGQSNTQETTEQTDV